jgi:DNA-binding MarR family transcriptional regulator
MKNTRSGGRSLHAIWFNENLTPTQRFVLLAFSSELNFKGNFLEERYLTHDRWAKLTGYDKRTIIRSINELEEKGYLIVRRKSSNGKKLPHTMYSLSEKLFDEYAKLDSAPVAPIDQTDGAPVAPVNLDSDTESLLDQTDGDTESPVKKDSDTESLSDGDTESLLDQTDGDTVSLHNSFMNQTPSNSNPPVCDYAHPRIYDQESHTQEKVDLDLDNKILAEKLVTTYFTNISEDKVFVTRQAQIEIMQGIIDHHGRLEVKQTVFSIFSERSFKQLDWCIPALITAIERGTYVRYAR